MNIDHLHFRKPLAHSPFYDCYAGLSKTENWATWNSYKVPRIVDKLSTEYFAVRSGCSVMDLTPMEKYRIEGPDAQAYLDRLVTRDLSKLRPGRVTYVVWCNDDGKVIDDGTLFQLDEERYRLCAQHHQLDWLHISAAGFDVSIDPSAAYQGLFYYFHTMARALDAYGVETLRTPDGNEHAWRGSGIRV